MAQFVAKDETVDALQLLGTALYTPLGGQQQTGKAGDYLVTREDGQQVVVSRKEFLDRYKPKNKGKD